jgi:tRNA(Ile2) C34 agmatinyltransferase TiaS
VPQLHKVTLVVAQSCHDCNKILKSEAWKRGRSTVFFCETCADKIEDVEKNKSQRRKKMD